MKYYCLLVLLATCCAVDQLPETAQDVCYETGVETCQRAVECQISTNFDECMNLFMKGCCIDEGKCGRKMADLPTLEDWETCLVALRNNSCSNITNGFLPAACLKI